jgi:hypothetical protein
LDAVSFNIQISLGGCIPRLENCGVTSVVLKRIRQKIKKNFFFENFKKQKKAQLYSVEPYSNCYYSKI